MSYYVDYLELTGEDGKATKVLKDRIESYVEGLPDIDDLEDYYNFIRNGLPLSNVRNNWLLPFITTFSQGLEGLFTIILRGDSPLSDIRIEFSDGEIKRQVHAIWEDSPQTRKAL